MAALWHFYWPAIALAFAIGVGTGWLAFTRLRADRKKGRGVLLLGALAAAAVAALWHGPLGAGDRMAARIEAIARAELDHYELPLVTARLVRGPLTRVLVLSGPADDFQQKELVRMFGELPGVSSVRWANPPAPSADVR